MLQDKLLIWVVGLIIISISLYVNFKSTSKSFGWLTFWITAFFSIIGLTLMVVSIIIGGN